MRSLLFCTVCDDRFLAGCLVMLHSMRQNIPNFDQHPVKIFFDDKMSRLSPASQNAIVKVAPHAVFEPVACEVYRTAAVKHETHRPAFLTLETFRQTDYDQVLFFDTDMLCINDISEMFTLGADHDFVACEAGRCDEEGRWAEKEGTLEGRWGKRRWFGLLGRRENKINTGLFLVGRKFRTQKHYEGLLRTVRRRPTRASKAELLDQWTINQYFGEQHAKLFLLPNDYNLRALHRLDEQTFGEVKILHYSGYARRTKPWDDPLNATTAYRLWHEYDQQRIERADSRRVCVA